MTPAKSSTSAGKWPRRVESLRLMTRQRTPVASEALLRLAAISLANSQASAQAKASAVGEDKKCLVLAAKFRAQGLFRPVGQHGQVADRLGAGRIIIEDDDFIRRLCDLPRG